MFCGVVKHYIHLTIENNVTYGLHVCWRPQSLCWPDTATASMSQSVTRLTPAASILPTLVWSLWARDADACCWPRALLHGKLISPNQVRNHQIGLQKTGKMALSLFNSILRNTHRHCYRGRVACHSYIFFGNQKARSEKREQKRSEEVWAVSTTYYSF